jgi:hypothetical protein
MREMYPELEKCRVVGGRFMSNDTFGMNGHFLIKTKKGVTLSVIASDGLGWEHVSVSVHSNHSRTPTWDEMCFLKSMFWRDDECVIQYHPAQKDYVNFHPYVLHLWRPIGIDIPTPPKVMV